VCPNLHKWLRKQRKRQMRKMKRALGIDKKK
jgi:hypothetical protein